MKSRKNKIRGIEDSAARRKRARNYNDLLDLEEIRRFSKQKLAEEKRYDLEHGFNVEEEFRRTRLWTKTSDSRTMHHSTTFLKPDALAKLSKEKLGSFAFTSTG